MNTYTQDVLDVVDRWAQAELAGDVDAYRAIVHIQLSGPLIDPGEMPSFAR